jgi:hypothetical protein
MTTTTLLSTSCLNTCSSNKQSSDFRNRMVEQISFATCTLQHAEQCIYFQDDEGLKTTVSFDEAARANTLQDAITTAKCCEAKEFKLSFPHGVLSTWIGALRNISHLPRDNASVLLKSLMVRCSQCETSSF